MPADLLRPLHVDRSLYIDTQLADDEIAEREVVRQAWASHDAREERMRQRRIRDFHWSGGML
jgi:hypothetical protein